MANFKRAALTHTFDLGHSGGITFSPDNRRLISGTVKCQIAVWDVANGSLVATLEGHTGKVSGLTYSPDGKLLASSAWDGTVRLWNPQTWALHETVNCKPTEDAKAPILCVAFSGDGKHLACGSYNNYIMVFKMQDLSRLHHIRCDHPVQSIVVSPDLNTLIASLTGGKVIMWDINSGNQLRILNTGNSSNSSHFSSAMTQDGRTLVTGGHEGKIFCFNASRTDNDRSEARTIKGHDNEIYSLAFSHDDRLLVSGGEDKTVRLWDYNSGNLLQTLKDHTMFVLTVALSPSGRFLATGSQDQTVKLYLLADWSDRNNHLFSPNLRKQIHYLMLVRQRLQQTQGPTALPQLPIELWLHIFLFLSSVVV